MEKGDMAVERAEREQLQDRVHSLKRRVSDLRVHPQDGPGPAAPEPGRGANALAVLRATGLISDPTPGMLALAREWEQVPAEEKERLRVKLDSLDMDPPLSQWIHANRT